MSVLQRKTPARLTEEITTSKISHWVLLVVGFAYVFTGLFFRDAWKTDDAIGLASMLSTYHSQFHNWLTPQIGHYAHAQEGPLLAWIGASSIYIFSPLFKLFLDPLAAQIAAARLPNFLYLFTLFLSVRYGSYLLARRPECQPLRLPFGGDPHPADYGRLLSDCAFLFVIASIGIVIRAHETSTVPLIMAMNALGFYGLVRMLDVPNQGTLWLILGLCGTLFARGLIGFSPLFITSLICLFYTGYRSRQKLSIVFALFITTCLFALWVFAAKNNNLYWLNSWWFWNSSSFFPSDFKEIFYSLRNLLWFTWPTWPFALIAIWRWRHWLGAPHLFIPAVLALSHLITIFLLVKAFEPEYSPLILPLSVLAAMSIPTLRSNAVNAIDWFAIMIASLVMIVTWLGWIALSFGWPTKINYNIMRLINGYETSIDYWALLAAILISAIWAYLIFWRIRFQRKTLWQGLLLSACGLTCAWILLTLLWLPAINYSRSYKNVAQSLSHAMQTHIPKNQCVRSKNLGSGQRALFYIYGNVDLTFDANCPWVVWQTKKHSLPFSKLSDSEALVKWQGERISERHNEIFQLILIKKSPDRP